MAENGGSEDRVKFQITVEGSEEAARAFEQLGVKIEDAGDKAETASSQQKQLDDANKAAATSAINFTTKLAGVANAVGELSALMGDSSSEAKLIGKIAATSAQMAQLGNMAGPQGALVGGIVGAMIPAFMALRDELESTRVDIASTINQFNELVNASNTAAGRASAASARMQREAAEAHDRELRYGTGGTQAERAAQYEEASARALAMERERGAVLARIEELNRNILETGPGGRSGLENYQRELDQMRAREVSMRSQLENQRGIRDELQLALQMSAQLESNAAATSARESLTGDTSIEARAARRASGSSRGGHVDKTAANEQGARNQLNKEWLEARAQQELDYMNMIDQEQARLLDERATAELDYMQMLADAERDLNKRNADARAALDSKERTRREAQMNRDTKLIESVAAPLGNLFAGAFEQAIDGQEDFGKAFEKGSKQMLTQFGTQMVAEGAGALLTAAGLAVINPPAAGGKAIEGAGKLALGIGLGAAGAAIQTGGAEAPAANGTSGSQTGESSTMVVNLNAPTVVGGTHAETGRLMGRSISESRARFNQRAA